MKRAFLFAAIAALSLASGAQAPAPNPADRPGPGGSMMGPGGSMMGPRFGPDVTPGWSMMTPEERTQHQEKMRSFKDAGACQAYMQEHQKRMHDRAQQQGKTLPFQGPGPGCDSLRKPS
jgi:hypothetical protein